MYEYIYRLVFRKKKKSSVCKAQAYNILIDAYKNIIITICWEPRILCYSVWIKVSNPPVIEIIEGMPPLYIC